MKKRLLALNGSAGAYVDVLATCSCRRVEIREDDAAAAVGITYKTPDDNFTQEYALATGGEPLVLGDPVPAGKGSGPILGHAAQPGITATKLVSLRSKTAGVTNVVVTEYF